MTNTKSFLLGAISILILGGIFYGGYFWGYRQASVNLTCLASPAPLSSNAPANSSTVQQTPSKSNLQAPSTGGSLPPQSKSGPPPQPGSAGGPPSQPSGQPVNATTCADFKPLKTAQDCLQVSGSGAQICQQCKAAGY